MRISRDTSIGAGALALVVAAGAAHGQMAAEGWIIDVQNPVLAPVGHASGLPQSTVITLRAKFDGATDYAFAAGELDFVANELGIAGTNWTANVLIAPFDGTGTSPGVLEADGASGIFPGQLHFPTAGIYADTSNPVAVWRIEYTATDFTPRFIDLETLTSRFDVYVDATGISRTVAVGSLMEGTGRIQIIPAPATLALGGLAGLVAVRRRR
jgi:uncharacterized protein (TIGR03382 family)